MEQHHHDEGGHQHHILPLSMGWKIFIGLLIFTVITVLAARVDLGALNFTLAMVIATIKAMMVILFFMGLKYDHNENRVIFATSFVFVAIFIILTGFDLFFRPDDSVVRGPIMAAIKGKPKFTKPWVNQPEVLAHGKELFQVQCASCHGVEGKGNGPAAASLNPSPRDFTHGEGWKNGRKPSQVFGTLTKGLNSMPAFASLPAEDRWSVAHYILSLGPKPGADSDADLKLVGVDPSSTSAGDSSDQALPIDLAIEILATDG